MNFSIPEIKEEEFFEKHFEYGDDDDTMISNFKCAFSLFCKAYRETAEYGEMAEDGEVFESENAAESFLNLALSFRFCLEFAKQFDESVEMRIIPNAVNGSIQEFVNKGLAILFA